MLQTNHLITNSGETGSPLHLRNIPDRDNCHISWQQLQENLAAMKSTILKTLADMIRFISEQMKENSELAQVNVGLAESQFEKAKKAEKDLEASLNPPWWKVLLNIICKYILPIVLCVVAFVVFGPAAGMIAAAVFLLTALPIYDGKSVFSLCMEGISQGIGQLFHLSEAQVKVLQGVLTVVTAVLLAIAGGEAAAGEAIEEGIDVAAEEGASFASSVQKFIGANVFGSVTGNSGCWEDIFMGIEQWANPNESKDKMKEWAAIFAMIMNVIVMVGCSVTSASALSSASESASELSPIARVMGGNNLTRMTMIMNKMLVAINLAQAASSVYQGYLDENIAEKQARLTLLYAGLQLIDGTNSIINNAIRMEGNYLSQEEKAYGQMLGERNRFAEPSITEARAVARDGIMV